MSSTNHKFTWMTEVETFYNFILGLRAAVTAVVKGCEYGLGLLRPRLYAGPVCDDSAA